MAETKKIKFNLTCDNNTVRTIEDLQNNFSIEDILSYFKSKLLEKWLEVRGYTKEYDAVVKIPKNSNEITIIKELIEIFNIKIDENEIKESVRILRYENNKVKNDEKLKENDFEVSKVVSEYGNEYINLIKEILENPNDISIVKPNIDIIVNDYNWIFDLTYRWLFYRFIDKSPLAIMRLLMNEKSRKFYIEDDNNQEDNQADDNQSKNDSVCRLSFLNGFFVNLTEKQENADEAEPQNSDEFTEQLNFDKHYMFKEIKTLISNTSSLEEKLGANFKKSTVSDNSPNCIAEKGTKCMVLKAEEFIKVQSHRDDRNRIPSGIKTNDPDDKINNKFLIFDGLEIMNYQSGTNPTNKAIWYMEV